MGKEVKVLVGMLVLLAGIILMFVFGVGIFSLPALWIGIILLTWGFIEIMDPFN